MDINDFRGLITAATMLAFLGICAWAWSSKRKQDFEATESLPLEEDNYLTTDTRETS